MTNPDSNSNRISGRAVYPADVLKQLSFVALDGGKMLQFAAIVEITVNESPAALARLSERALLVEAVLHPEVQSLYAAAPTRQMSVLGKPAAGACNLKIGCAAPL